VACHGTLERGGRLFGPVLIGRAGEMPPTNVLTADREKILAEIATPAKGGGMVTVRRNPAVS
jgi:hypothetical protein